MMAREDKTAQNTRKPDSGGIPAITGRGGSGTGQTESRGTIKPIGIYSHRRGMFQFPRILRLLQKQRKQLQ